MGAGQSRPDLHDRRPHKAHRLENTLQNRTQLTRHRRTAARDKKLHQMRTRPSRRNVTWAPVLQQRRQYMPYVQQWPETAQQRQLLRGGDSRRALDRATTALLLSEAALNGVPGTCEEFVNCDLQNLTREQMQAILGIEHLVEPDLYDRMADAVNTTAARLDDADDLMAIALERQQAMCN
jgi:hypothetical protein